MKSDSLTGPLLLLGKALWSSSLLDASLESDACFRLFLWSLSWDLCFRLLCLLSLCFLLLPLSDLWAFLSLCDFLLTLPDLMPKSPLFVPPDSLMILSAAN